MRITISYNRPEEFPPSKISPLQEPTALSNASKENLRPTTRKNNVLPWENTAIYDVMYGIF
jgi:hypothetical protein